MVCCSSDVVHVIARDAGDHIFNVPCVAISCVPKVIYCPSVILVAKIHSVPPLNVPVTAVALAITPSPSTNIIIFHVRGAAILHEAIRTSTVQIFP
jgi:hypothetical protein